MTLPKTSVQDITADVTLATSKPKIKANADDLLTNDNYLEQGKTDLLGGASAGSYSGWKDLIGDITVRGSGANDPTWAAFLNILHIIIESTSRFVAATASAKDTSAIMCLEAVPCAACSTYTVVVAGKFC